MRNIHPAALVGIILNFFLAWVLFTTIANIDLSLLQPDDRETMEAVIEAVYAVKSIYYVLLAMQAVGLACIVLRVRFGLAIAAAAAFFTMPGSLIYIIGCALTHYRVSYDSFKQATANPYLNALFVYPSSWILKTRLATALSTFFALVAMFAHHNDIALIMFGIGLAGLYCSLRATRNHALALDHNSFVIVPELFAPRLAFAYADVRAAELLHDKILFDIETPHGSRKLTWSLHNLDPRHRDAAVEELGTALTAHHVPLR